MSLRILLLEDDPNLGDTLCEYLIDKDYQTILARDIAEATRVISTQNFDLYLLDIGLPDGNGIDFSQTIKSKYPMATFLFLSALNDPETRLQGLESGALDYITKPFDLREISLRIANLINRKVIEFNSDEIILNKVTVLSKSYELLDHSNQSHKLSSKECDIIGLLFARRDQVVSRDEIIEKVWGENQFPSSRTVDNYIVNLRKLIETNNEPIKIDTQRGIGYKLKTK